MNKSENLYPRLGIKSLRHYLLLMMRVFLIVITIGLGSVFGNSSHAQTKIDINVRNVSLEELFKEIQSKSEFIFFYKDNVLHHSVSLKFKNATLKTILDKAFENTGLTYIIDNRQVVIKETQPSGENNGNVKHPSQDKFIKGTIVDE